MVIFIWDILFTGIPLKFAIDSVQNKLVGFFGLFLKLQHELKKWPLERNHKHRCVESYDSFENTQRLHSDL